MKKETTLRFRIEGMTCSACSSRIERVLNAVAEIKTASVSLATSTATITLATPLVHTHPVPSDNTTSTSFADSTNTTDSIDLSKIDTLIMEKVEQLGFKAFPISAQDSGQKLWEEEQKRLSVEMNDKKKRLIIEAVFSLPIMFIAMGAHIGMPLPSIISMHENPLNFALIQLILLLPVSWSGREFYLRGIPNLLHGAPNMDSLVAIGTGSALLYSLWSTYEIFIAQTPEQMHMAVMGIYYESFAILITLISFGKYLELRSKTKTQDAIKILMDLSPKTVSLVTDDGTFIEIAAEKILLGDHIFIRSGNQIPVDGIVIDGASSLDMSAITGEFMPVRVQAGDKVTSGSISIGGAFTMKAEHVGSDTVLSKIIALVQEAQGSKAPIARLADLVSLYFVPTVMIFAVLTGMAWYFIGNVPFGEALKIFVAVMVVACPCALGLATPMSVMVATGRAAKLGLLIKNGTALELAGKVHTIVFDKTGTLTEGKPHINIEYMFRTSKHDAEHDAKHLSQDDSEYNTSLNSNYQSKASDTDELSPEFGKDEQNAFIMQLASSIEQNSDHPLAKAFIMGLQKSKLKKESSIAESNPEESSAEKNTQNITNSSNSLTHENPSHIPSEWYEFEDFEEVSGRGLRATLRVKQTPQSDEFSVPYCIGNQAFMHENNIVLTDEEKLCIERIMQEGKSPLIFGQGDAKAQTVQKRQTFMLQPFADVKAKEHVCCGGAHHNHNGHDAHHASTEKQDAINIPQAPQSTDTVQTPKATQKAQTYTLPVFDEHTKIIAIFSVEDRIRDESKDLIQSLKKMGIRPMLLSGDNAQSVYAVAQKIGIEKENCIAEVLPADKEAQIRKLQAENIIVAMVGDGINDAPALAKADVGMVMGSGMDIAMEAGDLVLLRGINGILSALRLSRATISNIKLSLFWAFAYNLLLLPVAAGLFLLFGGPALSPMLAGGAMAFSSFSVVTNALRLRNFK